MKKALLFVLPVLISAGSLAYGAAPVTPPTAGTAPSSATTPAGKAPEKKGPEKKEPKGQKEGHEHKEHMGH